MQAKSLGGIRAIAKREHPGPRDSKGNILPKNKGQGQRPTLELLEQEEIFIDGCRVLAVKYTHSKGLFEVTLADAEMESETESEDEDEVTSETKNEDVQTALNVINRGVKCEH